jgi:DNA-binding transcriptional LysR family regulator
MDLKRLYYFCTVAEYGKITQAARALNMAQPPLSQRIRELEADLGVPLFIRQGRQLTLNAAGRELYQRAEVIFRELNESREAVLQASFGGLNSLRIGFSPTCRSLAYQAITLIRQHYPHVELGVIPADSQTLLRRVQQQKIDLALIQRPFLVEDVKCHLLPDVPLVAVLKGERPEAPTSLNLSALGRYPLYLLRLSSGLGLYDKLLRQFQQANIPVTVAAHSTEPQVLLDLLDHADCGAAVLPENETGTLRDDMQILPLETNGLHYKPTLIWPERCSINNCTESVVDLLVKQWGQHE